MSNYGYDGFIHRAAHRALSEPLQEPDAVYSGTVWHEAPAEFNCGNYYDIKQPGTSSGFQGIQYYTESYDQGIDVQLNEEQLKQHYHREPITQQEFVPVEQVEDSQYVLITTANCIDCDKLVNLSKDDHPLSDCILSKPFRCSTCGETFNFEWNLDVHKLDCHVTQADFCAGTSCPFCVSSKKKTKTFCRFLAYKSHLKTHYKPDVFVCTPCDKEFDHEALHLRHRRLKHRTDNDCETSSYSSEVGYCPKCKRLIRLEDLSTHQMTHQVHQSIDRKRKHSEVTGVVKAAPAEKKKPHQCTQCPKSFRRPAELRRHVAVHGGGKQWACSLCDKKFVHESGLLSHKKSAHNSNAKQFTCKICKAVFTKMSNVERHVKQNHPLDSTKYLFDCDLCSVQLHTRRALQRHITMYHMEGLLDRGIHQCGQCLRTFPRHYNLQRHLLSCTFKLTPEELQNRCNRCGKGFKFRASLIRHMEIHTRRDVADPTLTDPRCPICMKHISSKSNLAKHLLTHQANYECPDCLQRFTTLHRLDRHRCVPLSTVENGQELLQIPSQVQNMEENCQVMQPFVGTVSSQQEDMFVKPTCYVGPPINPLKSYFCKRCPTSFYSFKASKEHQHLHCGIRSHLCWICHKSFRTRELLEMHRQFHTREHIYCDFCPQVLYGRVQYGQHVRAFHQSTVDEPTAIVEFLAPKQNVNRAEANMSTQSYTEDVGRQLAESLFQTRAMSADPDQPPREYIVLDNGQACRSEVLTMEAVQDRAVRCSVCYHHYDSVAMLVQHWSASSGESLHAFEKITCPLCNVTLRGANEATGHMMYVHPYLDNQQMTNDVSTDASSFGGNPNQEMYLTHQPTARTQKIHACEMCDASFAKHSDLVRHIRRHTGEKPFICQICNRGFSVTSSLNAHVKTHSRGDPEHKCPLCPKVYFTKNALTLHLRVHSGEKPLRCRFCPQTFRTSNKREAHEKTMHHVGNRKEVFEKAAVAALPFTAAQQNDVDLMEMLMNEEETSPVQRVNQSEQKTLLTKTQTDSNHQTGDNRSLLFPVKRLAPTIQQESNLVATMRQISRVKTTIIQPAHDSAFATQAPLTGDRHAAPSDAVIYVTARRLSDEEYNIIVSKMPPKAIRVGIDETFSMKEADMKVWSTNDVKLHLSLPRNLKLSLSVKGVVDSLGNDSTVTLRARPTDLLHPRCVELVEDQSEEIFCKRCDVCEIDFPSKDLSDAHFASDDHEAAQFMHPPPQFAPVDNMMPTTNLLERKEASLNDYNCKLCGRKYLDMEPLIAHIRRDHERDHQQQPVPNYAARPAGAARTAPPAPVPQD